MASKPTKSPSLSQIEVARQVQAAFLPKNCPTCTGVHVAAKHLMSQGVGGDLHDFVPGQGKRYSLVIGDVVGHELYSSLVMSLVFGAIHSVGPKADSPIDVVTLVNDLLCDVNDELRSGVLTCSLFCGTVDPGKQRMVYANAGHPPPIVWRWDDRVESLQATCPILGVDRGLDFSDAGLDLRKVYRLLLYTDGVAESRNPAGQFFNTEGIINALLSTKDLCVEESIDSIVEGVVSFAGGRPDDDITVILADFSPSKP